jgi:hypothetical protein
MAKKLPQIPDKGGRPRIYDGETGMKAHRYPLAEYKQWQDAAKGEGISLTQWIVNACRRATRKGKGR